MTSRPAALVLSSSWRADNTELSFVTRAVAGAVSRSADVTVVTYGRGVFDALTASDRPYKKGMSAERAPALRHVSSAV